MELVVGLAVHWLFVSLKPEQHGQHGQPRQVVLHPMVRGNADTQQHITHDNRITLADINIHYDASFGGANFRFHFHGL